MSYFEISENENLQSINENYILYDIKFKYPKSLVTKALTEHQKKYINFICFIEYYSEYLFLQNNNVNEILLIDTPCENIRNKIKSIEDTGYQIFKTS